MLINSHILKIPFLERILIRGGKVIYAERIGEWIKVNFKWNSATHKEIIFALSSIPGHFYNQVSGNWGIPYTRLDEFEAKLKKFLIVWKDGKGTEGKRDWGVPTDAPILPYNFKMKPFKHQMEGFNILTSYNRLILGDEMGLGKTFQILTSMEARYLTGQIKRVLILTKASIVYSWRNEVRKYTNQKVEVIAGSKTQRHKIYADMYYQKDVLFYIMSYDTYRTDYGLLLNLNQNFQVMVLDEAHKIKSPKSKIGQLIHNLPADYKYAVTGTPIINNPLECYNILKWLGLENRNYYQFENRYAVKGGFGGKEVIAYKNLDEIRSKIQMCLLRRLKSEVLDLPPKIVELFPVEMTDKQKRFYKEIKTKVKEEMNEIEEVSHNADALTRLIKLKQCTSSPRLLMGGEDKQTDYEYFTDEEGAKITALKEQLEELCKDHKVIVYSQFKSLIYLLLQDPEIQQYNPACITGDVKATAKTGQDSSDRQKQVDKFQTDDTCRLFLGTTGACREGLTLTAADHEFFIDFEWAAAYNEQTMDRAYRIGQDKTLYVHFMVCEDTVDEVVWDVTQDKKEIFDALVDIKPTSRISAKSIVNKCLEKGD